LLGASTLTLFAGCTGAAHGGDPVDDSASAGPGFATQGEISSGEGDLVDVAGPADAATADSLADLLDDPVPPSCGDDLCGLGESSANCPADCGVSTCGDGACDTGETPTDCPQDCGSVCGDGVCDDGETAFHCAEDCSACPDSSCNGAETTVDCPEDCGSQCEDGACNGGETSINCPQDCGSVCGDDACNGGEASGDCPEDCGTACNDGVCAAGETSVNCPQDCGSVCGDGACNGDESSAGCVADCGSGSDPLADNDADFVSQVVPSEVSVGASFEAQLTFRNAGLHPWSLAHMYFLGSENPQDNFTWSTNRMAMTEGVVVTTHETYTFTKTLTAPDEPGSYVFQWRMLQDAVAWFGALSPSVTIEVVASTDPPTSPNDAQFVSQSVPMTVEAGASFVAQITMLNTSQNPWSKADAYFLGSENPMDNFTWSTNRMKIDNDQVVGPSESYTFTKTLTAPDEVGSHDFQWRMVQGGVGWFGAFSENLSIEVTAPTGGPDPPGAPNLSQVVWLHTDVSGWAQTANLSSVTIEGEDICLAYDKKGVWPIVDLQFDPADEPIEVVANPWVFIYQDDTWYAGTWEWLRPNQTCKKASAVSASHIKVSPFSENSGWAPASGQVLYFMVSGLARHPDFTNVEERSNLVEVVWP
ncbi:MAG: NBR1-Ig-like domain-containing protein, partial [Myxococcota bacterium]|nr:NBR1-Ig-like domain-containing protein [Myxococcota bacterium]